MKLSLFLLKRVAVSIPFFFFLTFFTMFLIHMIPGNYFDGLRLNPQISPKTIEAYENLFHLNEPLWRQYISWLVNLAHGNFGYSFTYLQPVAELIRSRTLNTLLLSVTAFLISWGMALLLGFTAALWQGGIADRVVSSLSYLFAAIPAFFLGVLLVWLLLHFPWIPLGGVHSVFFDELSLAHQGWDFLKHVLPPALVLAAGSFAFLFKIIRAQILEVQAKDFYLFLRSYGISRRGILLRHGIKNSFIPLAVIFGFELPAFFSGAAITEMILGWPGLGQLMLTAVRSQDLFLVMGNLVMISVLLIMGSILSDILLGVLDPRIVIP